MCLCSRQPPHVHGLEAATPCPCIYPRRERPTAWVPGASRRLEEAFVVGVAEGGPAASTALTQAQAAAAAAADLAINGAGPEAQELLDGASAEARALLVRYAPEVQAAARAAQAQAPGVQAAVLTAGSQLLDSLSALTPNPRPGVEPFDGSTAWPRGRPCPQPPRRPSAAPGARPLARGCPLGPREERPPRVDAEARQGRRRPGARPRVADSTGVGHPGSLRTPRASSVRCCATARSDSARRVPSRSRGTPSSTASIGARFAAPTPRPSSPTSSRPRTRRTSTSSRSGRPTSRVPPLATRTVGFPTPTSLSWATSTSDTHRAPMLCSTPSASRPTETNRAPGARAQTGDPPGAPAAPPPR